MSHHQIISIVTGGTEQLQWPSEVPAAIADLGARCLAFLPSDRPKFYEVCQELEAIMATLQVVYDGLPASQAQKGSDRASGTAAAEGLNG